MVSVEMDMDASNQFRVYVVFFDQLQGTAVVVYGTRNDAEAAVAKFDNQELSFNGTSMNMRVRMLGNVINVSGETPSKTTSGGFFRAAMDNPEQVIMLQFSFSDPRFGPDYVPEDEPVMSYKCCNENDEQKRQRFKVVTRFLLFVLNMNNDEDINHLIKQVVFFGNDTSYWLFNHLSLQKRVYRVYREEIS